MSKIVQAVNAMILTPDRISKVIQSNGELFFLYDDKYKWSMTQDSATRSHRLWFYPGDGTIEVLASYEPEDWEDVEMIGYSDAELGTKEARASFSELYSFLKERLYGVDRVLEDIISKSPSQY